MNKIVESIELVFENMDYIVIPAHYFEEFCIKDVRTDIWSMKGNEAIWRYTAKVIKLVLKEKTDRVATTFEGDMHSIKYDGETLFERIYGHDDITSVNLIYEDESFDRFAVEWLDGKDEYHNKYQTTRLEEGGKLVVNIQEGK